jgi:hypothetical protein
MEWLKSDNVILTSANHAYNLNSTYIPAFWDWLIVNDFYQYHLS